MAESMEVRLFPRRQYLLPIADREPLAWILREQRTAFGDHRARQAHTLEVGDVLFLYTTRGCFRNPTRDRGRVIGRASVAAQAKRERKTPSFGARAYPWVVELDIEALAPLHEGVELAPLVPRLRGTFPDPTTWSARMRRALVALDASDAAEIDHALESVVMPYRTAVPTYARVAS